MTKKSLALWAVVVLLASSPAFGSEPTNGPSKTCKTKLNTCLVKAKSANTSCIKSCGLPLSPGYDKCTQTCNEQLSNAQLDCKAQETMCQAKGRSLR